MRDYMKKVYVFFVFLFTLFIFGVKVKVDAVPLPTTSGDLSIEVDEKLPTSFLVNTEAPNFQDYFIVKLGNAIQQTDVDLFLDGFDIGVIGDYLISGSIKIGTDTVGIELPVKVIESDTEGPVITIKNHFILKTNSVELHGTHKKLWLV